jgi:hypothetical protein
LPTLSAIPKPGRETSRFHNVKIATEWLTKSDSALQVPLTLALKVAGTTLIQNMNSPLKIISFRLRISP